MMMPRYVLVVLLLCGLSACSTATAPQYYAIALPDEQSGTLSASQQPVIAVSDVELADYLSSIGIVYQQDDVQLTTANQHRWAEALDKLTKAKAAIVVVLPEVERLRPVEYTRRCFSGLYSVQSQTALIVIA